MPAPKNRSNSVRQIKTRNTHGKSALLFKRRKKGSRHASAISAERLPGVSSSKGTAKTQKTPNRLFGGTLSSSLSRRAIRMRSRLASGEIKPSDIPLNMRQYVSSPKKD